MLRVKKPTTKRWGTISKQSALVLTIVSLSIFPTFLDANELTNHGFTSRSTAMAEAVAADVNDVSALYYNPAGLAGADSGASLNFNTTFNLLNINLYQRDAAFDIPQESYDGIPIAPVDDSFFPPIATGDNPNGRDNTKYTDISASLILGLTLDPGVSWIRFALATFIPLQKTQAATSYPDSREQHFSNRLQFTTLAQQAPGPIFMMGTGMTPARWLKLGATIVMYRRSINQYSALLASPTTGTYSSLNQINKESKITPGFNLGLEIDPHEKFGIAISYRHRMYTGETLISSIETNDYSSDEPPPGDARYTTDNNFVTDYNPSDLTLGIRFGNHCPWVFNIDATWRMWSRFKAIGDGIQKSEFHDVVIPKLGFEYEVNGRLDLRLGASYIVNPVYNQDAETNFVDNDRVKVALGLGIDIPWPPNAQLDFHAQLEALIPRTFEKRQERMRDEYPESVNMETGELLGDNLLQTNNPGFPGYQSKGIIISLGTALNVPF